MNAERRYREDEIAAIFREAAEAQEAAQRQMPHGEGLTLAELKQIGGDAGITPEFIARAAAVVDRSNQTEPPVTTLGIPVGVGRTVDLPRPLSDEEWDLLVVDLRETFKAFGKVGQDGSLRQWTNGNLHALVEPTESGHRLRLGTVKGSASSSVAIGLAFIAMSLLFVIMLGSSGEDLLSWRVMMPILLFGAVGLGSLGLTAYRLPRWAKERQRQMDEIATRTLERMSAQPTQPLRETEPARGLDVDMGTAIEDDTPIRRPDRTRT